jgi:hypothetical protein
MFAEMLRLPPVPGFELITPDDVFVNVPLVTVRFDEYVLAVDCRFIVPSFVNPVADVSVAA